jgi:hypothetical protein
MLAVKKQPKVDPAAEAERARADNARRAAEISAAIARLQADLIAFVEQRVQDIKKSLDGAGLPIEVCRGMVTRGDHCWCRIVDRLINEESK